jgi:xylulokinase
MLQSRRIEVDGTAQYILAIDVGTTTVRAIAFTLDGLPAVEAYCESHVYHPRSTWAEVEPDDWWRCTIRVIHEVLDGVAARSGCIIGIGLTGLLHALIPIDEMGNPLARAMLWMDQRCAEQVEWMAREHGPAIEGAMGTMRVSSTWSAPKLRWISENQPELLARTHRFLSVKDYIRMRLTDTVATDPSDAGGTFLFDRVKGEWSSVMLDIVGVPLNKMAPIRPSTEVAGGVTAQAAALTGLPVGTPVVVGGGDTAATRLGANVVSTGRACLYLGTAAWVSGPQRPARGFGATATTGAALKWLVGLLGAEPGMTPSQTYRQLDLGAEKVSPGANGLLFLPHLMGERGPQYNPQAKGVLFGLTLAHGRAEVTRAVLEGCALHLRSILDGIEPGAVQEMVVVGGGAKSALWRGIIADVTGVRLFMPQVLEAGSLGAAIFAAVGLGIFPSVEEAADCWVRIAECREPQAAAKATYDRIYPIYLDLEERVAPLYGRVPVEAMSEEA